jgi:hypothetical protein
LPNIVPKKTEIINGKKLRLYIIWFILSFMV